MTATLSFKIRTIKNQIAACLREIARGVKSFIDRLVVLEGHLDKLEEVKQVEKQVKDENYYYNLRQAVINKFQDVHHIPLQGSPKQVGWASRIRNEALESLAVDVCEGDKTEVQVWEILKNPSASWWIDNRSEWVSY